ncbi:MAG TPA: hypothetical protein VK489_10645, partial [Ferruginibacter sp.]|nr:hypothetical protein [Ferruginibacter sp.]
MTFSFYSFAQSTSWKGITSTSWNTASNWTNGVPSSTVDAIIGDAGFTGSFQPSITSTATCNALTLGGIKASTLTIAKNFTINNNFICNSNGGISHGNATLTVKANWTVSGAYSNTSSGAIVNFAGLLQTIGGSTAPVFRKLKINSTSTVTLATNISAGASSNYIRVYGVLIPGTTTAYTVTAASAFTVYTGAVLKVNAATLAGNYVPTLTLNAGSTVEYSSTTVNQTISALTYSTLVISGNTIKTLAANLPSLMSSAAAYGNIYVNSGTFDLAAYTANRGTSVAGGVLYVGNNATLKIGGTQAYPTNYLTNTLVVASTVEYSGTSQTVGARTYGNLTLSSSSGAAVKTFPGTALLIAGNFTSSQGTGTSVSCTAAADLSINGNITIGSSTTISAASYTISLGGSYSNSGTFSGGTGTVIFTGASSTLTGSGTHNFYNITIAASNVTASSSSNLVVAGNLTQTLGNFTHTSGGTLTMSGTSKTISGSGLVLYNLTVSGTITSSGAITLAGNLSVGGTFTASAGTLTMSGVAKTISGAGTILLGTLNASGSISTAVSISISTNLTVSGGFTASAGTITFTGSSSLSGTANFYNITINGTSLQLATDAVLGIANTFAITTGTLNVSSSTPNTVNYNGTGAQSVVATTYCHLIVSNGNTKTAAGAITVNQDFVIGTGTVFNGSSYIMTIYYNWTNNGTFTAATSTIQFSGSATSNIYGATNFNILTINNTSSVTQVVLRNNITVATINMTQGRLITGSNTLTITTTRTGNGIILGTITRTHSFSTGISYAFEGPDNTINFTVVTGVTSITVTVTPGNISDFPFGASLSRLYTIAVPAGTYIASLRLHYEDAELNGNNESTMALWKYNGSSWNSIGKTSNNSTSNYVELMALTDISNRWSISDPATVVQWNGSISNDWNTAANWTTIQGSPSKPPSATDIVELGTASFTNQPTITTTAFAKNIVFGSAQAVSLTLSTGGSLTTAGTVNGSWTANAVHTINLNNQNMTVNGDLILSNGVSGRIINLNAGTGTLGITGSLNQSAAAALVFSGAGNLTIGKDYNYTSGSFTPSSGTVTYNGTGDQVVAGVVYNHLNINKTSGLATINADATVGGNLVVTAGELDNLATATITGNTTVNTGAIFRNFHYLHVQGNWTNNGTYTASSASIYFDGAGTQNISSSTFNNLNINKPVGSVANLTGDVIINGDLVLTSGTFDIKSYNCNRSVQGGTIVIGDSATFIVGANNSPLNFSKGQLAVSSNVIANGTGPQYIFGLEFGNLIFRNAGVKTLVSPILVKGNLIIEAGSTFDGGAETLTLNGNWVNSGTYIPSASLVIATGAGKTFTGNTIFNRVTIYGSYTNLADISYNGLLNITNTGSISGGASIHTILNGDLINSGTLYTLGTTTFSGTSLQTLSLINPVATVAITVNFNGSVSPVLNSTSSPQFGYLNINNTGGISPSVGWNILYGMTVSSGAYFNGGASTHNFYGSLTNNGIISSSGTLNFIPAGGAAINTGSNFSSTGTVILGGTGAISLSGSTALSLNNVIISNKNAAGISPSCNWSIANDFSIGDSAIFNAGSNTFIIAGDMDCAGTLNEGTSTFNLTGAANDLTASYQNTTFYDLVISGVITAQSEFLISHNFTNNNSFDASIGMIEFTGNLPSLISGTASPFILAQVETAKDAGATTTLGVNITGVTLMDIEGGILDMGVYSITQDASGGNISIDDGAILKIGGTNSLPVFDLYAIDTLSTVDYTGTIQAISTTVPYGNLSLSSAGTKTAPGVLNILNNFSLTNATFVPGSYVDTLCGNWNMSSGTYTNAGNTIYMKGPGTQTISSSAAFNNITLNKTTGKDSLLSNITVNGNLNFVQGRISTGAYSVIMASSATLTGASQTTGWVDGKLQKNVATGSNVSRTFETGDSSRYAPATTLFASVSTAGNVTVNTVSSDHPSLYLSGIDVDKGVNRYHRFSNNGLVFTTATITLNWVAADVNAGASTAVFLAKSFNGSAWSAQTTSSPLATSIQLTGVSSLTDFAAGELATGSRWDGSEGNLWGVNENWNQGVPLATYDITIPAGLTNYPVLSSGTSIAKNINIQAGASLTVSGGRLQVSGAVTNNGTLDAANGTIEFNGSAAQTIAAGTFTANAIGNLVVSNSSVTGLTLAGATDIYKSLVFTGTGKTLVTGGYLNLRSTASRTARLGDMTGNTISGSATVERYINIGTAGHTKSWLLLSTPTSGQSVFNAWMEGGAGTVGYGTQVTHPLGTAAGYDRYSASTSIKTYISASNSFDNGPLNTSATIDNAKGYFLYIRGDRTVTSGSGTTGTTLRTKGTLFTPAHPPSTINIAANAYETVGNPYASQIDFSLLGKTGGTDNTFYAWDPALYGSYGAGGYQTISAANSWVPVPGGGNYNGTHKTIESGQAVFVHSTGIAGTLG